MTWIKQEIGKTPHPKTTTATTTSKDVTTTTTATTATTTTRKLASTQQPKLFSFKQSFCFTDKEATS